jgi:cbb3-type cytochrome oxidase maturation protein
MTIILFLLVVSLTIGAGGLGLFLWSLRSGQYEDLDGAANRILFDEETTPAENNRVASGTRQYQPGPLSSAPPVRETPARAAGAIRAFSADSARVR